MSAGNGFLDHARALKSALITGVFSVVLVVLLATSVSAQSAQHPLDGLTGPEYWVILDALQASGHPNADTRYPLITLREPPKDEVLQWKPGNPFLSLLSRQFTGLFWHPRGARAPATEDHLHGSPRRLGG
jgi:hypothetical protein